MLLFDYNLLIIIIIIVIIKLIMHYRCFIICLIISEDESLRMMIAELRFGVNRLQAGMFTIAACGKAVG